MDRLTVEEVNACKHALMGREIAKITEFEGISLDRLEEICNAERDGRVVVLPCKVGDTVYVDKGVTVKSAEGWRTKRILFVGKVVSFRKNGNGVFLKIRFSFMEGSKSYMCSYVVSAIGKTIFLTREEAEKALRERDKWAELRKTDTYTSGK